MAMYGPSAEVDGTERSEVKPPEPQLRRANRVLIAATRFRNQTKQKGHSLAGKIDLLAKLIFPMAFVIYCIYYVTHYYQGRVTSSGEAFLPDSCEAYAQSNIHISSL